MDSQQALKNFHELFLDFQFDSMDSAAENLLAANVTIREFLEACMPCMDEIGKKFEAGEYFLPQLVAAGEMFKTVSKHFEDSGGDSEALPSLGAMVLGTPQGDIHNLGKDIFSILAQASGFEIHDLGVDVAPEVFVKKIEETQARFLGLSALLTTTFDAIEEVVALLAEKGLRQDTCVIIGGGATEQSLIEKLGVDAQTRDAIEGIRIIKSVLGSAKKEAV